MKLKTSNGKRLIMDRVGEINTNKFGSEMIIDAYYNANNIIVRFPEHGNTIKTVYRCFSEGTVGNPYDKTVYGKGYLGEGRYNTKINGETTVHYRKWNSMMTRCYRSNRGKETPSYIGCEVAEEWHNFQTFAKWYDENYYEIDGEIMSLDKDILIKGNKVYSPETCVFVPYQINNLFIKSNSIRGEFPIGVTRDKCSNLYKACCKGGKIKYKYLGLFRTPEEAFQAYKIHKEQVIKETAEEHKNKIPKKLYEAMMNYKVEIDD